MPIVSFAPHLQRHVPCATQRVAAATLGEALRAAFVRALRARRAGACAQTRGGVYQQRNDCQPSQHGAASDR
jgi:hypothetical protein